MIRHDNMEVLSQKTSASIEVENLSVVFGEGSRQVIAVRDLSFTMKPGEVVCLLGASGCGKSTILNAIAGFVAPSSGGIVVAGRRVNSPGPERGMVFQNHALFPWKTVRGNIEFGLRMIGVLEPLRARVVQHYIDRVGLCGFENYYPSELSGGMQQRVGLARALAVDPVVLLMDEPFGSLDTMTRLRMQELLMGLWSESQMTIVFVTHDVDEAIILADRLLILSARPAHIKAEIAVELPRPRSSPSSVSADFVRVKHEVLRLICDENGTEGDGSHK